MSRIALFSLLIVLVLPSRPYAAFLDDCTGQGLLPGTPESQPELSCAGSCPSPKKCKPRNSSDTQGDFEFCGCDSSDLDACCTVVLRPTGDEGALEAHPYGTCPACGVASLPCAVNEGGAPYCPPS